MGEDERFGAAVQAFTAAHCEDPRTVEGEGGSVPRSVRYHATLASWVDRLESTAPIAVRLAARAQHLRRWTIPRAKYPAGRVGYKRWRSDLARMHADEAVAVLHDVGYEPSTCERVRDLLLKKRLKSDPDVQLLEDAVCLTFLELEYADFARAHDAEKVISILRRTWDKMSTRGHRAALELAAGLPGDVRSLLERAVAGASGNAQ